MEESSVYNPKQHRYNRQIECRTNQQTTEFCAKLEINDPLMIALHVS